MVSDVCVDRCCVYASHGLIVGHVTGVHDCSIANSLSDHETYFGLQNHVRANGVLERILGVRRSHSFGRGSSMVDRQQNDLG